MNSRIFQGMVMHARLEPLLHQFEYPIYFYSFDLDELESMASRLGWLFGYNRKALVSLWDKDYLGREVGTIKTKLLAYLRREGVKEDIARIELITSARFFNYVFNPVSFYYCYEASGALVCCVAEVNNTFKERHLYILKNPERTPKGFAAHYTVPKSFHVSPFNDMSGQYDFYFSELGDQVDIRLNILREGSVVFRSRQAGKAQTLTRASLLRTILKFPLTAALTMPRILWQAARLRYQRRLAVHRKPIPASDYTIRKRLPTIVQRMGFRIVTRALSRMKAGRLMMRLPEGQLLTFGKDGGTAAEMTVNDYKFFSKLCMRGAVGLGESYQAGEWDSPDVTAVLTFFASNLGARKRSVLAGAATLWNRIRHSVRKNSRAGSKRNIQSHYDLSNDFFRLFLDKSLTYSSAKFEYPGQSLEEAQLAKVDALIEKARIGASDHVLEIGSGWGTLAIRAAKSRGCRVTTITLSNEQFRYVTERVRAEGLSERVSVQLIDYRDIRGTFDKIVSVEMLEAVGHEYLPTFFSACERLLAPNGLLVLQVITLPDARYPQYLRSCDWIQKYIFPGAVVPSINALSNACSKSSGFVFEHMENLAPHYAATLCEWRRRFDLARTEVESMGFDRYFQRTWSYYLSYCEAGFASRVLNVHQIVLSRSNNQTLIAEDAGVRRIDDGRSRLRHG